MIRKTIAAVVLGVTCASMNVEAYITPNVLVGAGLGSGLVAKARNINMNMDDARETARQYWHSAKERAATGRDATVTFAKNHKRALIATTGAVAAATALVVAHQKGYLDTTEAKFTNMFSAMQNAMAKAYTNVTSVTMQDITSRLTSLSSDSWNVVKGAATATGNGVKDAGSWVGDKAGALWGGVKNVPSRVASTRLPRFVFGSAAAEEVAAHVDPVEAAAHVVDSCPAAVQEKVLAMFAAMSHFTH